MSLIVQAFGFGGGWSIERRTSRAAKARERAALHYTKRQGERVRAAETAPPISCACGCGVEIRHDPWKRGPKQKWASTRCYMRDYQRKRRASMRTQTTNGTNGTENGS